ncbi:NAD(P)/FAD-dependent oxidoreductase [Microbacterium sp. EYE_5]|uniref:NAD(P)/FAD-dependent oxidoreductase n=1 Tax=unclassified Microbacterium TaxID=2609290 RepID=UPI002006D63B|nr:MULTISPECIES: FAD/NAD(P)-binding oxidoreductase [unclassified Microbacterium]MCK6079412.1 NAD(P)/FAD-dependent oxidoreductase [Microbacterium sp. EYE_382]MCK6084682.1 NAD(P)/FAD-dependent oxidoreductase [Microbacterium sp. EYE_384]MCK6123089.1 NAD(P)/FAD-dependent oxidoreductase [Microbacterium sp. EYE_80]MCK6125446.1 NAD(P)/FAD-dependent oxidoreductase [Microbacterium sp. EYE_79]MCK6140366.1 NAD(P)/FAD-dependent oxidoreductase [Microbacterium sp. EYE_39]
MTGGRHGVVIVGAGASGLHTAEALRSDGYDLPVAIVGDEPHDSYDRPPLSKALLRGELDAAALALRPANHLAGLGVERHHGRAAGLDVAARCVHLDDGRALAFDHVVIATGVRPRTLAMPGGDRALSLHTVEDGMRLRTALAGARRVVVIGGGVLGTEIAGTTVDLGAETVLACPTGEPLAALLGAEPARRVMAAHYARGLRVRRGDAGRAVGIEPAAAAGSRVVFADGTSELADVVIATVGSDPAVDWIAGSGLDTADGVRAGVDASAAPGVYAVGDVLRWPSRRFARELRVPHRTQATDSGLHVGARIATGEPVAFDPVPYFWTDQLGQRVQSHGHLGRADEVRIVAEDAERDSFVAVYCQDGRLTGVTAVKAAKAAARWRGLIEAGTSWADALAAA